MVPCILYHVMGKMSLVRIKKTSKKVKKAVDKRGMIWYIKQAVSDDSARERELKKSFQEIEKRA